VKAGWEVKALGEVCAIINGGTPKSEVSTYWDGDIDWLTPKDMGKLDGHLVHVTPRRISREGLAKCSARQVPANSVIMSTRAPIGHLAINTVPMAFNQGCRGMVPGEKLNAKYLFYVLSANIQVLDDLGTGTTFKELSAGSLKAFPLPLPPLDEQKRIVEVLDAAFEGLSRARAHTETNLQNARELFESALRLLFSNTATWKCEDLNKHVRFVDYRGKTPPKTLEGVRLITAKNVKRGYIQRDPEEFMDETAYDEWMTRGFPEYGDVLFTTEAPLANVAQLDTEEKVVVGQRLINMKADPKVIDNEFLKFALLSPTMQGEIHRRGTGATVQGIKASLLKTVPLSFPASLVEQCEIAEKCRLAFEVKGEVENLYRAKLADLDALRQALLQKAFAGELT
jgi:type I restriction enzyme S subunit